jgi:hypothetical protein
MTTYFTVRIVVEQVRFEKSYNEDSTTELVIDWNLVHTDNVDAAQAFAQSITELVESLTLVPIRTEGL